MRILVLGGGNSPERDVSIRSAAAVSEALRQAGFEVVEIDPSHGYSFLDNIGKDDIVFPILHGAEGEDGVIQKLLEERGISFLGSSSEASADCFDKGETRRILTQNGISMPKGDSNITLEAYRTHPLRLQPHVLKAQRGGSSIGTYLVKNPDTIDQAKVEEVFALDSEHIAVIEELIDGMEITVPILDGVALPVIEIIPPKDGEFDYENKYNGKTHEICPAETLSDVAQKQAQQLSEKVHALLGCRHISRIDIMLNKAGDMYVLEANTMPGMTNQSLFPLSAYVAGLSMPELMKQFVKLVQRDSQK